MNKNQILFCDTCGEMKMINYKYVKDDLLINCECVKERKKRSHPIELFLNNKYKSTAKLKCQQHNSSFTQWCETCKINICENCLNLHNYHKLIKLSSIIINNNDINDLEKKIKDFGEKLEQKKKVVEEKKLFNQKEENEFFINFNKYYNLNINEISFVRFIKEQYDYLLKNNTICYQIIINLKYLIDKLNTVVNDPSNKDNQKNEEINDFVDIYNVVFKFQHFCLLPNNDNEENEKRAEEMQNSFNLERSSFLNLDVLSEIQKEVNFNNFMNDIPLIQSINLTNSNMNIINKDNNNPNENDDNKSLMSSNFNLLHSKTMPVIKNKNDPTKKEQYFGTYKNGKYHCEKARLIYPNGYTYEGPFKEGLRNGTGTLSSEDKTYLYKGGWVNDKKHGKCTEVINGETFEGFYKDGIREGKCTITYNNKDKFVGSLIDGKKEGYGEQYCFSTKTTYKGEFRNNLFEGKGIITNDNGYYYEGGFLGGLRHGDNCTESKAGVRKYVGQFRRDKMDGKGVYEWYQGESKGDIYNGEFKEDLFDGLGTYKYCDGTIYIGEYKRGIKEGKGKMIYSDGSFYEGEFRDGNMSGKGVFQDLEGNVYEGNFYNGNKHSKGKITFMNGDILEGLWLYGMKEGNFVFIDNKGDKFIRKYIKDELIEQQKEGFLTSVFNNIIEKISNLIK